MGWQSFPLREWDSYTVHRQGTDNRKDPGIPDIKLQRQAQACAKAQPQPQPQLMQASMPVRLP